MKCTELERYVDAYLDGEFEGKECGEVEVHLATCSSCRHQVLAQDVLRRRLRETLVEGAPDHLRSRVLKSLDSCLFRGGSSAEYRRRWLRISAFSAGILVLGFGVVFLLGGGGHGWVSGSEGEVGDLGVEVRQSRAERVVENSIDWHRLRLPMEVTSARAEDVRGWFDGKVDFSLQVPDFDGEAALLGGRLAHMGSHRAAMLTLEVRRRKMSVMAFPVRDLSPNRYRVMRHQPRMVMRTDRGYHVVIVNGGDVAYSFVSDLPKCELRRLMRGVNFR